jgi:acid phosphatase
VDIELSVKMKLIVFILSTIFFCSFCFYSYMARVYIVSGNRELSVAKPDENPLKFIAVGDLGENYLEVLQAMDRWCLTHDGLDAVLLLGDNFMPNGVRSVDDPLFKEIIEKPFSDSKCLNRVPIFAITGNHDEKADINQQILYSNVNKQWNMPSRFYSVTFGNLLRIVWIDSHGIDLAIGLDFSSFIKRSLAKDDVKWKIVMGHQPLFSGCFKQRLKHNAWRTWRHKKFMCNNMDAYLSGHFHFLEYVEARDRCKADMFIVGGGGDNLRECDGSYPEATKFFSSEFGFLSMIVDWSQIRFEFVGLDDGIRFVKIQEK